MFSYLCQCPFLRFIHWFRHFRIARKARRARQTAGRVATWQPKDAGRFAGGSAGAGAAGEPGCGPRLQGTGFGIKIWHFFPSFFECLNVCKFFFYIVFSPRSRVFCFLLLGWVFNKNKFSTYLTARCPWTKKHVFFWGGCLTKKLAFIPCCVVFSTKLNLVGLVKDNFEACSRWTNNGNSANSANQNWETGALWDVPGLWMGQQQYVDLEHGHL